jgi:hypothetical protein
MNSFTRRLATALGLSAAATGLVAVGTSSPASASECTAVYWDGAGTTYMCGGITNNVSGRLVAYAVGTPSTFRDYLYPGQTKGGWQYQTTLDVDGFRVPFGCTASVSGWGWSNTANATVYSTDSVGRWYKIANNQQISVNSMSC